MTKLCRALMISASVGMLASVALGQWSVSSTNTFKVSDLPSSSNPIVVPTSDGGCYVGWTAYPNGATGIEPRVQRLNAAGIEQWAHNGIRIAPGDQSSTIVGGLDLAIASDGGLLVTCDSATDPTNPGVRQCNVQKLDINGNKLWGSNGGNVAVSSGEFWGAPCHVCATNDGGCIVGYSGASRVPNGQGGTTVTNAYIQLMRYTAAGTPAWGSAKFISNGAAPVVLTCLQPGGNNSFIAEWLVSQSQSQLVTRKFNGDGTTAWPAAIVLDSHGLTSHDFPTFVSDGAGGGVYAWRSYANNQFGSASEAVVQHVLSNGTLKFATPLASVDNILVPANQFGRQSASLAYNQTDGTYFVAAEQGPPSSGTSRTAIVQKFSSNGTRLYTDAGFTVVDYDGINGQITPGNAHVVATPDGGCMVFGTVTRGFTTTNRVVYGAKVALDGDGFPYAVWSNVINSDTTTDKGRLAVCNSVGSSDAIVVFAWDTNPSSIGITRVDNATGAPGVVAVEPTIVTDLPATVQACDNGTVTLSLNVSGTPNIVYRWRRHYAATADAWAYLDDGNSAFGCAIPDDGTTYSGTHSATLVISHVHALPPTITCSNGTVTTNPSYNQYSCVLFNAGSLNNPVTSSTTSITITNTGCCVADHNHSGTVTVQDIFSFLSAWFAGSISADANASGTVTVQDIFSFLSHWFGGC